MRGRAWCFRFFAWFPFLFFLFSDSPRDLDTLTFLISFFFPSHNHFVIRVHSSNPRVFRFCFRFRCCFRLLLLLLHFKFHLGSQFNPFLHTYMNSSFSAILTTITTTTTTATYLQFSISILNRSTNSTLGFITIPFVDISSFFFFFLQVFFRIWFVNLF